MSNLALGEVVPIPIFVPVANKVEDAEPTLTVLAVITPTVILPVEELSKS